MRMARESDPVRTWTILNALVLLLVAFSGCIQAEEEVIIRQGGSSTVLPLAEAWSGSFGVGRHVHFELDGAGSNSGIHRLCAGQLDIADASRAMRPGEEATCRANGVAPVAFQVATDGIVVVMSHENDYVDALSLEELQEVFGEGQAETWADVRDGWPDDPVRVHLPGLQSGTRDFFMETVLEPAGLELRGDAFTSQDDDLIAQFIRPFPNSVGIFGRGFLPRTEHFLDAVPIDAGDGPVAPSLEAIEDGAYPLSRPLYLYTDGAPTDAVADYLAYALGPGQEQVEAVGYLPLSQEARQAELARLQG